MSDLPETSQPTASVASDTVLEPGVAPGCGTLPEHWYNPDEMDIGGALLSLLVSPVTSTAHHGSGCFNQDKSDCGMLWLDLVTLGIPAGKFMRSGSSAARGVFVVEAEAMSEAAAARVAVGPGPQNAWNVLEHLIAHGSAPAGYKGGRVFKNAEGMLPHLDNSGAPIVYREWDVNPFVKGVNRGAERIVTGSNGAVYYTSDHYQSFVQYWSSA